MFKILLNIILVFLFLSTNVVAQDIALPKPNIPDSLTLVYALENRQSTRSFDATKSLSNQEISNILWVAYGFNRDNKRTVPSGYGSQEFSIYAITKNGVYKWNDISNTLEQQSKGDSRAICGAQPYVADAALNLVYVADYDKLVKYESYESKVEVSNVNCGFIGQNVYLYCVARKFGVIFRGGVDKDLVKKTLKLKKNQHVMYSQSIGYIK